MVFSRPIFIFATLVSLGSWVQAESHRVTFENHCKGGTPKLIQGGNVLSTGQPYLSQGPLRSAIAYLDDAPRQCGFNGEQCTLVELTLVNPTTPGSGSSVDLSLIPPHEFSVASGVTYTSKGSCNGNGVFCNDPGCREAFHKPDDTDVQVACQDDDAGITIIFCDSGPSRFVPPRS